MTGRRDDAKKDVNGIIGCLVVIGFVIFTIVLAAWIVMLARIIQ